MKDIRLDRISSQVFNCNVVDWHCSLKKISFDKLNEADKELYIKFNPKIVTIYLPSSELQLINNCLRLNYEFIQSRFTVERDVYDNCYNLYPFEFIKVAESYQLKNLLTLCEDAVFDDRFSVDPMIDKKLALERNKMFLKQSFEREDEYIFLLVNKAQKTINGFRSFKIDEYHKAQMLLSSIVKRDELFDYNKIINNLELRELNNLDIRLVSTVISINNYDELNRYISEFGYKVVNLTTVLRKFY